MRNCWSLGFRSGACTVSRRASSPAKTCTFSESFSSAISLNNSRMRRSWAGVGFKGIGILSGIRLNYWAGGPGKYWIRKVGFIVPFLQMRRAGRSILQNLCRLKAGAASRGGNCSSGRRDYKAIIFLASMFVSANFRSFRRAVPDSGMSVDDNSGSEVRVGVKPPAV